MEVTKKGIEVQPGDALDEVVLLMQKHYHSYRENVMVNFNGVELHSESVTLDNAYKAVTGMSYPEFYRLTHKE